MTCLQILINLTCKSAQVSNSLIAKYGQSGLYQTILQLLQRDEVALDAAWLLNHLVHDGNVNFSVLFEGGLFSILA